jgi:predicted lipoprotein with Yx(FWY)xxD motif
VAYGKRSIALAIGAVAALGLSACASGYDSGGYGAPQQAAANSEATPEPTPTEEPVAGARGNAPPKNPTTKLINKNLPRMGRVLTNQKGFTLYRFDNDTADPPASNCADKCAKLWPPAVTDSTPELDGVDSNLVDTITRADGGKQITINGWPVYTYIGDKKPGTWKGQNVGGTWFAIAPTGKPNKTCMPKGIVKPVPLPAESSDTGTGGGNTGGDTGGGYSY